MANLKQWILDEANGHPIIAVVIGEMGWGNYGSAGVPNYDQQPRGTVLTWDEAAPLLDYNFDSGYGAPGCNAIYAWTDVAVIAISQYDGSTGPYSVPRNPTACMPNMVGG